MNRTELEFKRADASGINYLLFITFRSDQCSVRARHSFWSASFPCESFEISRG